MSQPKFPLVKRPGIHEGYRATHPAFGMITINRVQGRFDNLVGVDFPQGHAIRITISESEMTREYASTSWFEGRMICDFYLSEVQFAQAISSLNSAERTPVTLRHYRDSEKLFDPGEPPAHMTDLDGMEAEIDEVDDEGVEALEEAIRLAKEGKVKRSIVEAMEKAYREIKLNREFRVGQSKRSIRRAADKAKMEVTAFAQNIVRQFGLKQLGADQALLMDQPETAAIEDKGDEA